MALPTGPEAHRSSLAQLCRRPRAPAPLLPGLAPFVAGSEPPHPSAPASCGLSTGPKALYPTLAQIHHWP
ncbi:hypothetical protein GUJ93_ZPchr0013g37858 [Zizania palustris]|uniref:Uncharacterized protein n=1 Tax=Zizania palustris TaxID=103762 RepID=A0A8J5X002_ZIZPA|nr:hypothetical protein GUJ93_ZPchr0013g37858 [Zizania palustris]